MNDEQLGRATGQWLRDIDASPIDPSTDVRQAMEQVRMTGQVRRSWPFQLSRRKTLSPTPTDNIEYEPSPILATNGHTPTVIGRTSSMLSPAKAITAGVLVFALGGVLLIAQPFEQQTGSLPGAEAEAIAPTWVTGGVVFASNCEDPTMSTEEGVLQQRGFRCGPQQWQSDDPRFTGTGTVAHSSDAYTTDDGTYQVISSALEVRNDAGGWHCTNADALLAGTSLFDASLLEFRMTCAGDGDYAGTTAILVVDFTDLDAATKPFEGLVFPGEVPPFPETSPEA